MPVLEVFKSFAHRVFFVLLIRQAVAKPFQGTCKNFRPELAPVPLCVFAVGAGKGGSPGRGSCFFFTPPAVLWHVSPLVGWRGEPMDGPWGWDHARFQRCSGLMQRCRCHHRRARALGQLLWLFFHGHGILQATMSVTVIKLLKAF